MDPRLEEASIAGDINALHTLLQADNLILARLNSSARPTDNPLHVAALLGHIEFGAEILRHTPCLARGINARGLSPLHLASAGGHLHLVREILKAGGVDLCRLHDGDGIIPLHTAASNGWVRVLEELIASDPESAGELTYAGDTALHLALKSNCFEAAEFLVRRMDDAQEILINSKDENGDTALHLATAKRQVQTMKLLLNRPGIDVNALNLKGQTVLDVLLESPCQYGDLTLGEIIRAAGGNATSEQGVPNPPLPPSSSSSPPRATNHLKRLSLVQAKRWFELIFDNRTEEQYHQSHRKHEDGKTSSTVMVVSTLIATITFQAAVNPPGGFDQTGKAILGEKLNGFLIPDMIGLFASLSVILLFICVAPRGDRSKLTKMSLWVMWIAVYSTAIAFTDATSKIFPHSLIVGYLLQGWSWILAITILWVYLRFVVYLLRTVGWWWEKKTGDNDHVQQLHLGVALILKRIMVVLVVLTTPYAVCAFAKMRIKDASKWVTIFLLIWFFTFGIPILYVYLKFVIYLLRRVGLWSNKLESNARQQIRTTTLITIKRFSILLLVIAIHVITTEIVTETLLIVEFWRVFRVWNAIFGIPTLMVCFKFIIHLLQMVGIGCHREEGQGESRAQHDMDAILILKRIMVILVVIIIVLVVASVELYYICPELYDKFGIDFTFGLPEEDDYY